MICHFPDLKGVFFKNGILEILNIEHHSMCSGVVLFCFISNLHPFNFSSTLLITATIIRRQECSLVALGGLPPLP